MPKNVLLITSDQQHWSTLGVLNSEIKTPNLDKLAKRGMLFNRAYCPNPTCTPTRASIITGQYPSQHGAYTLGTKLLEDRPVVGNDFHKAGYKTALIGKAHFQPLSSTEEYPSLEAYPALQDLDYWREFNDEFYGFDHVELARNHTDEAHVGQHYAIWMEEKGYTDWRKSFSPPTGETPSQQHKWNLPEAYHYNTWIAERTNARLDHYKSSGENFFLWASFFDPHPSYLVSEPWDTMYDPDEITIPKGALPGEHDQNPPHFQMTQEEKPDFSDYRSSGYGIHGMSSHLGWKNEAAMRKNIAVYYGMVSMMDKYIGNIIDHLDDTGLSDDTLIMFTSDHGHFYGQHGLTAKGPFHYDDVIRVPFIAACKDEIPENTTSDALLTLVDVAPTALAAVGIDVPFHMSGKNQMPVFTQEAEAVRDHVIVENHHDPITIHVKTYVGDRYKLTVYYNHEYGELFDMEDDPDELKNLWDDPESQTLKQVMVWKLLQAEMGKEVLPMPRIAHA